MTSARRELSTISFLSDQGLKDEFVGIAKSVIRTIAPTVSVIDISHDIEPHDVRAGGLCLARAVQYMAPGVVLGVVDPSTVNQSKPIAIEVADGQAYLVGPDNGLFAPAVSMVGGATAAVILDNVDFHLASPGPRLEGRDVFAPVAAHLCAGVPFADLGTPIDPAQLIPGVLPVSQVGDDGSIVAEVLWVDRFGNVQLNVDPDAFEHWDDFVKIEGGRTTRTGKRVDGFAQIGTGSVGVLTDPYGLVVLAIDRGSAAMELSLDEGSEVTLRAAEGSSGSVAPVTIQAKPTTIPPMPGPEEGCDL